MRSIFISYRRDDTGGHAGRLASDLVRRFGRSSVFIDIDATMPGRNFEDSIHRALDSCKVTLVLIGDEWLTATPDGKRRIDDENDYVRREVAAALKRADVTVIPLLVERAQIPRGTDLPPDVSSLVKHEAAELSNKRWRYDLQQLCNTIEGAQGVGWWERLVRRPVRWATSNHPIWTATALASAVAIAVAVLFATHGGSGPLHLTSFQSPTGNIGCRLTSTAARCDIRVQHWNVATLPSCSHGRDRGLMVGRGGPATFVCAPTGVIDPAARSLAYGKDSQANGFTCHSSTLGVTCKSATSGHGFSLNREKYKRF